MASQLNPAWRRKGSSPDQLAHISEQFLSDDPPPETTGGRRLIPVLLADPGQRWFVRDLGTVLNRRGQPSFQCAIDTEAEDVARCIDQAFARQGTDAGLCLLSFDSATVLERARLDHLVMLVPASLDGVREAYRKIKRLSEHQRPEIGVVIIGPRDQHAAWRFFRKLAVGALRFLDLPLLNLGFLPGQVAGEQDAVDHHRLNFLTRISERLLRSEFHTCQRTPASDTSRGPST